MELTAYHAIVSITVPVILVELAYPEAKAEPWLKGKWLRVIPGLLLADVVFGLFVFSAFTGFFPPLPQYAFMALLTAAFLLSARRLPSDWARRGTRPMRRPRFYGLIALTGAMACGLIFWVLPNMLDFALAPPFVILLGAATILGVIKLLVDYDWRQGTPMHRYGLTAGVLSLFIVFSFFQELDTTRLDDTSSMSLVGLAFLIGLLLLRRRLDKETENTSPTTSTCSS